MYHALRAAHPQAELGWAVQPEFANLLSGLPGLTRILHFGRRSGLAAWPRLHAELSAWSPDWAIDIQGNLKSALVTLCSGAARRTGMATCDWTEPFGAHVLTDRAPASAGQHAVERVLSLVEHIAPGSTPRFDIALSSAELWEGERQLRERTPADRSRPLVIIDLAAAVDVRSWPQQHFVELGLRLQRAGARVLFLSGPAEAQVGTLLADAAEHPTLNDDPHITHWVAQRGLRALAAFFTAAAAEGGTLLACDSGPAHLAAACSLPVHLLAGPQDPGRTGPWPPVLSEDSPHGVSRLAPLLDCQPCFSRRCAHHAGPICMSRLEPRAVLADLTATLGRNERH